jgi:hypothetical protein
MLLGWRRSTSSQPTAPLTIAGLDKIGVSGF